MHNVRRRLELELSNRKAPATRNTEHTPNPPSLLAESTPGIREESSRVEFISPKPGLKSPDHPPVRVYPQAQSRSLDFLLSEQSILSTVMRVPDAHEGMAKIHDMLLEHKEELMGIIETYPAVMGSGRASSVSSEKQSCITEAAAAADNDYVELSEGYTVNVGEDRNHVWKVISYLLCGRTNVWRSVRLFFVWTVMNETESMVTLENPEGTDPENPTKKKRYVRLPFSEVAIAKETESADGMASTVHDYITALLAGEDTPGKPGLLEMGALLEWLRLSCGLWQYSAQPTGGGNVS